MTAAEPNIDEENLLKDAVGFATEHRFYLRKAVQHGDFYSAVRHSLCMANELRSCRLSPTSYYKLYSMVFLELQHLGAYLRETARHGFSLEEVFEIVQYEGNCLPRLYMLVTVGVVRMLAPDSDESPDEILRDMESMVGAVQHPVRGLFLRYFLLQVVKDKLHMLQEGALGALNFLLTTFREAVSLWHRLRLTQVQVEPSAMQAWQLDDHRYSLRLLLGAHLMQVARVDGLTQDLYTEVVLPELLRLIPACEDAAGQAYLLQLIVEVFPDSYHLHTLDKVLATCAQVHWSIDLVQLTQHLLRRLTVHLLEGGDSSSSVTVFELFHAHFKLLHGRPRTAATPLISLLTLQLELCMFVLALHPGNACLEILEGTVDLLQNSGEGETENSAPEVLDTQLAQAVVDLMAAPLTKERLCSAVLQTPYHATLLAMLSRPMQSRAAMAMVTALLAGDVSLGDCGTLRQLFTLMSTLLQDETGQDDEDTRPRHLEHDPIAFRREQETVAQLIHQVRHEDPTKVIEMLFVLWEYFREGGPHRIIFSVPAMVSASLELADRLMHTGQNQEQECSELVRIFDFTHTLCQSLGTLIPKESLRLWLLCAASADRAAALKNDAVLAKRCSSCVDKALVCLEEDISKQEARLCGLQLFVGTLQQMKVGPEEPAKLRQRAVALCGKMLSKRFQSKAFCLCCELFWLPQPELQDPDNGLLCLRRALQSADRAIHSDPSDVGLFVDILNEVSRLFAKAAGQVSPAVLSKTVGLCIQHVRYIGSRVPVDSMRALHAILADLAAKQVDSVEAVMAGDANVSYLEVDLRPAEKLTALQSKHDVANSNSA